MSTYDSTVRLLREMLRRAESQLREAERLIELGEKAGEDMTAQRLQAEELRRKVALWKQALGEA